MQLNVEQIQKAFRGPGGKHNLRCFQGLQLSLNLSKGRSLMGQPKLAGTQPGVEPTACTPSLLSPESCRPGAQVGRKL